MQAFDSSRYCCCYCIALVIRVVLPSVMANPFLSWPQSAYLQNGDNNHQRPTTPSASAWHMVSMGYVMASQGYRQAVPCPPGVSSGARGRSHLLG